MFSKMPKELLHGLHHAAICSSKLTLLTYIKLICTSTYLHLTHTRKSAKHTQTHELACLLPAHTVHSPGCDAEPLSKHSLYYTVCEHCIFSKTHSQIIPNVIAKAMR